MTSSAPSARMSIEVAGRRRRRSRARPSSAPSCTANDPTPPAPPWTSSRWPGSSLAASNSPAQAVTPPIASVAAWSNETAAGLWASVVCRSDRVLGVGRPRRGRTPRRRGRNPRLRGRPPPRSPTSSKPGMCGRSSGMNSCRYPARILPVDRVHAGRVDAHQNLALSRIAAAAPSRREGRREGRIRGTAPHCISIDRLGRPLRCVAVPLQNRVTPFGELIAHPGRGLVYGNRGCLHDAAGRVRRHHNGRRWIACQLQFRGWQRGRLLQPGRFTELFFLDEATAFAAGHRPCALCRRADYDRFLDICARTAAHRPTADEVDARLHAERFDPATRLPAAPRRRRFATSPTARSCSTPGSHGLCAATGCCAGRRTATCRRGRGRTGGLW